MGRGGNCIAVGYAPDSGAVVPPDPSDAAEVTIGVILNANARGAARSGDGSAWEAVDVEVSGGDVDDDLSFHEA